MKVSILQADLFWEDKQRNLAKLSGLAETVEDTRVLVLPEMFSTGFTMNAKAMAETTAGPTMEWMQGLAAQHRTTVVGSMIIVEEGRYYNRLFAVHPDGSHQSYNKRHLFAMGGESDVFTPGNERVIIEVQGWRIFLQVCYDLRFPVWMRNTDDYDACINVANWPKPRISAWSTLLRARAMENQVYMIGANRVGVDGKGMDHVGASCIIDPNGATMAELDNKEGAISAVLSLQQLTLIRKRLPFLPDQDAFTLLP